MEDPRTAPDERATADALQRLDPHLARRFDQALPAARATVLTRLWSALAREPVPTVRARRRTGTDLTIHLTTGRRLRGPAHLAEAFATVTPDATIHVDDHPITDPTHLAEAILAPDQSRRFAVELANCVANLALARAAPRQRPPIRPRRDLADFEQDIIDGHPLHPCCRTRIGLDTADVIAYAPEHRRLVHLPVVDVPRDHWHSTGRNIAPRLALHPTQLAWAVDSGLVTDTGRRITARPLMSLRTLAPLTGGHHVKTAVNVQISSSLRTLPAAALHNGPLLSDLLSHLCTRVTGLAVLSEPAAGGVLVRGRPHPGLSVILRRTPQVSDGEVVVPLAALTTPDPVTGVPLAVDLIRGGYQGRTEAFVDDLSGLLLPSTLGLLHLGVALEAHGQNVLLVLSGHRPSRVVYRDFGEIRVSPQRLARYGVGAPVLRGRVTEDDPQVLRGTLFAALVSTALSDLLVALAGWAGCRLEDLWSRVARVVDGVYRTLPRAARGDGRALLGEDLPVKALTAMRLAPDPQAPVWAHLPNPMAGLG